MRSCLSTILSFISMVCAAQGTIRPNVLVFYKLTEQDGLPDDQATCFYQDTRASI